MRTTQKPPVSPATLAKATKTATAHGVRVDKILSKTKTMPQKSSHMPKSSPIKKGR